MDCVREFIRVLLGKGARIQAAPYEELPPNLSPAVELEDHATGKIIPISLIPFGAGSSPLSLRHWICSELLSRPQSTAFSVRLTAREISAACSPRHYRLFAANGSRWGSYYVWQEGRPELPGPAFTEKPQVSLNVRFFYEGESMDKAIPGFGVNIGALELSADDCLSLVPGTRIEVERPEDLTGLIEFQGIPWAAVRLAFEEGKLILTVGETLSPPQKLLTRTNAPLEDRAAEGPDQGATAS